MIVRGMRVWDAWRHTSGRVTDIVKQTYSVHPFASHEKLQRLVGHDGIGPGVYELTVISLVAPEGCIWIGCEEQA